MLTGAGSTDFDLIGTYPAVIAAGESVSAAVSIGTKSIVGVQLLASSWANPGNICFQGSCDGGETFQVLNSPMWCAIPYVLLLAQGGVTTTYPLNYDAIIMVDPAPFRGVNLVKVQIGEPGNEVVQPDGFTVTLIGRGV